MAVIARTAPSFSGVVGRARRTMEAGLVAAMLLPLTVLTRPVVPRALLALALIDIPLQWDKTLAYRVGPSEFGAMGGFTVSATTLALLGLYASWFIAAVIGAERPHLTLRGSAVPLAYVGFALLAGIAAYDSGMAFRELFLMLQILLLYLYVVAFVRSHRDPNEAVRFVALLLMLGVILESAVIIGLRNNSEELSVAGIRIRGADPDIERRSVGGTIGGANATGAYFSLLLAPALGLLLTPLSRAMKRTAVLALCGGSTVLALTVSRGAYLAFLTSVVIFCLAAWRRGRITMKVPLLIAVAVLALASLFAGDVAKRLTDDRGAAQRTAHGRLPLMVTASKMIKDHPIMGVGPNNYSIALRNYGALYGYWGDWVYVVHNKYMLVLSETGIGGFVAYLCFLLQSISRGWRVWRRDDPVLSPLALGVAVAIAGHMTHMFVDIFNDRPSIQLLWTLAALTTAMSALGRRRSQPVADPAERPTASPIPGAVTA